MNADSRRPITEERIAPHDAAENAGRRVLALRAARGGWLLLTLLVLLLLLAGIPQRYTLLIVQYGRLEATGGLPLRGQTP